VQAVRAVRAAKIIKRMGVLLSDRTRAPFIKGH